MLLSGDWLEISKEAITLKLIYNIDIARVKQRNGQRGRIIIMAFVML